MRLKQAEQILQGLHGFQEPKIEFEQYASSAHLTSAFMHTASETFGDVDGATVLDLGVGTGMLSAGALLYGAEYVIGVDVDADALELAQQNMVRLAEEGDLGTFSAVRADVCSVTDTLRPGIADVIIMNPPFGTKTTKGIDMVFLQAAVELRPRVIYSMHKSSTRAHVLRKAASWGARGAVLAELTWDLKATYKFHKKSSVDIQVDLIRLELA